MKELISIISSMINNEFSNLSSKFWKDIESKIKAAVFSKTLSQKVDSFSNNSQQKKQFQQWIQKYFYTTISSSDFLTPENFFSGIKKDILSESKTLGLNDQEADAFSEYFIEETIAYIKENNPDVYFDFKLDLINTKLDSLCEKQEIVLNILNKSATNSFNSQTIEQFNQYLLDNTQNPALDLGFFEVDDSNFASQLSSLLSEGFFYVKYYSQEEAVGCTLNTIETINKDRKVLIIKDLETWNKIPQEIHNYIFLADFYSDSIKAIKGNTCIFFTNESQSNAPSITLQRRKYSFLQKKLKNVGASDERANEIMRKSSGFFFIIWHEVFHGKDTILDEYKNYSNEILPLLLFPYWSENSLDFEIIKKEYGKDPKQLQQTISKFQQEAHPLVLKKDYYERTSFQLSSIETIWEKFSYLIDMPTFKEHCDLCVKILTTKDPYSLISKPEDSLAGIISNDFKKGFLKVINLCTNVFHNEWYQISDSFVKLTLDKAKGNGNELDILDQYSYELAEISPKCFLDFLENNLDYIKQLLLEAKSQSNVLLSFPLIATISSALDEIIQFDGYEERVLDLCTKINSWQIDYGNCNPNPRSIITSCFIPWFNYSGLSINSRINLESKYLNQYKNIFWQILLDALMKRSGPAISTSLSYRKQRDDYSVSNEEYASFLDKSISLLSDYGDCFQNSVLLFNFSSIFPSIENLQTILTKIKEKQKELDDNGLLLLGNKLRHLVFDAQFYKRHFFLNKNSYLNDISNVVNNLPFKNKKYKYLFVFCFDSISFPIKNPTPYNGQNNVTDILDLEKKQYLLEIRHEMQEEHLSITDLIKGVKELPSNIAVGNKADILANMTDGKFEKQVFLALLNNNYIDDAVSYERRTTHDDTFAMNLAKQYSQNPEVAGRLLKRTINFDKGFFDQLHQSFSIDTKKVFWDSLYLKLESKEDFELALNSLSEINNKDYFFSFFLINYVYVLPTTLFSAILDEYDRNPKAWIAKQYEIEGVLDFYKGRIENDKTLLSQASKIEIELRHHFYYTTLLFAKNPSEYAKLISFFYTKDDGSANINTNRDLSSLCYQIYYDVNFCPGCQNSSFDPSFFNNWINEFTKEMQKNNISSHTESSIWNLLCFSPNDSDGLPLTNTIRQYIEKNYTKEFASIFIVAESKKRGVFTEDGGDNTRLLGENYLSIGKEFKKKGLKYCSKIFTSIGENYISEAEFERKQAENNDW